MRFEGTYQGRGASGIVFRTQEGKALKIYRPGVDGEHLSKKERYGLSLLYSQGINVPRPYEEVRVTLSSDQLDQLPWRLRRAFRSKEHPALLREYIEGKILTDYFFPSKRRWQNFVLLNDRILELGYVPDELGYHPENYIATPDDVVYLIDVEKMGRITDRSELLSRRESMLKTPCSGLADLLDALFPFF